MHLEIGCERLDYILDVFLRYKHEYRWYGIDNSLSQYKIQACEYTGATYAGHAIERYIEGGAAV